MQATENRSGKATGFGNTGKKKKWGSYESKDADEDHSLPQKEVSCLEAVSLRTAVFGE
jgi:hypothetical protein